MHLLSTNTRNSEHILDQCQRLAIIYVTKVKKDWLTNLVVVDGEGNIGQNHKQLVQT